MSETSDRIAVERNWQCLRRCFGAVSSEQGSSCAACSSTDLVRLCLYTFVFGCIAWWSCITTAELVAWQVLLVSCSGARHEVKSIINFCLLAVSADTHLPSQPAQAVALEYAVAADCYDKSQITE